jgi:Zn-dependent protease with chaperone function
LITSADEEAELAGVMAHEIAHVAARHGTEQYTKGTIANYATIPLIFLGGGLGYGLYQAAGFLIPLKFLQFSRSAETEADFLGLQYVYKTGYDPTAFVSFFEKIQAQEKRNPASYLKRSRLIHRQQIGLKKLRQVSLPSCQRVINTSLTPQNLIISRVNCLHLKTASVLPKVKKSNRPSLKRRTSGETEDASDEPTQKDEDRPTLKRRTN